MAHATTLGFGGVGWPRFLMMPAGAAFSRAIIRVARFSSFRVGLVGLKNTASESASVAAADVQPLALLFVSAVTAGGRGLVRARLERVIPHTRRSPSIRFTCRRRPFSHALREDVMCCERLPWVMFGFHFEEGLIRNTLAEA